MIINSYVFSSGSVLELLFNGTDGSSTATHIGKLSYIISNNSMNGYIRDLRIKKEAVYTAAFTPPTSLF